MSWSGVIDLSAVETRPQPAAHEHGTDPPGTDPWPEPAGLNKFDLGMVPASVTPPRSSRQAAWFAVAASGAVLGGLLLATATIVGPSRTVEGMQLPGMPRARSYPPPNAHSLRGDPPVPTSLPVVAPEALRAVELDPPSSQFAPSDASAGTEPEDERPPLAVPALPELPQLPQPSFRAELVRLGDPEAVAGRSGAYFSAIRDGDLRTAYAMTTGSLRDDGYAEFAARYGEAAAIEVVSVSASSTDTVTELRVTRDDGSVVRQWRRLRFTIGDDPRVYADELVR